MLKLCMRMVAGLCWLVGASSALAAQSPEEVIAGFDKRVESMFLAESGKPLVRAKKNKPLGPGRGNYVRAYSNSMVGFAARCLYLNEMLEEANAKGISDRKQHEVEELVSDVLRVLRVHQRAARHKRATTRVHFVVAAEALAHALADDNDCVDDRAADDASAFSAG